MKQVTTRILATIILCTTLAACTASIADTTYAFVVAAEQPSGCADMEAVAYAPFAATNACAATVPLRGFPHAALSVRAPAYSVPCSIILR